MRLRRCFAPGFCYILAHNFGRDRMCEITVGFEYRAIELLSQKRCEIADDAIVQAACAGDETAFAQLFERHRRRVARIASNFFAGSEKIEDILQEVFTKIFLSIGDYSPREGASFAAWVSRIAVNACYDELRRLSRRPEEAMSSVSEDEAQVLNRLSHQQFHRGDLEARLISRDLAHKLLGQLSADDRLVLTLLEVEEFSVAEIAKVTDWSVAKVKVRAHRARAALRRVLNDFV